MPSQMRKNQTSKATVKEHDEDPVVLYQNSKATLSLSQWVVSFTNGHAELNCLQVWHQGRGGSFEHLLFTPNLMDVVPIIQELYFIYAIVILL